MNCKGGEPSDKIAKPPSAISPRLTLMARAHRWFQDPMFVALVAVVVFILIAPSAYKFFGFHGAGWKIERENRIKEIMDFIISEMHKRHSREEIKTMLNNSEFGRGEVEEAFRRLRIG